MLAGVASAAAVVGGESVGVVVSGLVMACGGGGVLGAGNGGWAT